MAESKSSSIIDSSYTTIKELSDLSDIPIQRAYEGCIDKVVVSPSSIQKRVKELAQGIADHYKDTPYTVLVIMKGALQIWSDVQNELNEIYRSGKYDNRVTAEYLTVKSYVNTESTKKVNIIGEEYINLEDQNVLIFEDIVDTGRTMTALIQKLKEMKAKEVRIFSLILKEGRTEFPFKIDHVGFVVPDKFIIGYGFDFNQHFRDLSFIGQITQKGIEKFKA